MGVDFSYFVYSQRWAQKHSNCGRQDRQGCVQIILNKTSSSGYNLLFSKMLLMLVLWGVTRNWTMSLQTFVADFLEFSEDVLQSDNKDDCCVSNIINLINSCQHIISSSSHHNDQLKSLSLCPAWLCWCSRARSDLSWSWLIISLVVTMSVNMREEGCRDCLHVTTSIHFTIIII